MYIKRIHIKGFRNYIDTEVLFHEGINVIIGHNNAGKSNLLKALQLVLEPHSKNRRLSVHDFSKRTTLENLKEKPPMVTISVIMGKCQDESNETNDDIAFLSDWLIKLDDDYEAQISYVFCLQDGKLEEYRKSMHNVDNQNDAWRIISNDFMRYYSYQIIGGNLESHTRADFDLIEKFDFQFLEALRNVENDLFTTKSSLWKEVLGFFLDYDKKIDNNCDELEKEENLKTIRDSFSKSSDDLMDKFLKRLAGGKVPMLKYAEETGASFNKAEPDFSYKIDDSDLFNVLRLIVNYETNFSIPITHNGLGYNNLIFISLLLAKMQADTNGKYLGSNAKIFPILAIEEPEAHLHPSMQYKFLRFLKDNYKKSHQARQIFVTTHSTQITSAVELDDIICIHSHEAGKVTVCYPSKTFDSTLDGIKSKGYVKRFLDATKSDMLFAQKILMVEGVAEELLIPVLAKYMDINIEDYHIAIVNVNGRYFEHFVQMFDSRKTYSIPKKVACLTDRDPVRKKKGENSWKWCYPYELNIDSDYDYKLNAIELENKFNGCDNIQIYSQDKEKGKTFEYELMRFNPKLKLLITGSLCNREEINQMQSCENYEDMKKIVKQTEDNKRIINSLDKSVFLEEDKASALISSIYLNSLSKGENSLELSVALAENLEKGEEKENVIVPLYIKEALEWLIK